MKRTFKHLSSEERDQLAVLVSRGMPLREIGRRLGRSPGTLSRELKRNGPQRGGQDYRPHQAQARAAQREKDSHRRMRLKSRVLRYEVEVHLLLGWTPELIAGQFRVFRKELPPVCAEAIYQWVYSEAPHLIGCLPRAHKKRFPRRRGRKIRRTTIPHRTPIKERPPLANSRQEPGHWESDLMIGRGRSALQNSAERVSRSVRLQRVPNKSARACRRALAGRLGPLPPHMRRSLTYDNGTENTEHQILNLTLGTRSYFCAPYHSWEKGTVENRNGIVRRFFPKQCDFDSITDEQIQQVEDWINNRPMKCLGFKSPRQVFDALCCIRS